MIERNSVTWGLAGFRKSNFIYRLIYYSIENRGTHGIVWCPQGKFGDGIEIYQVFELSG
jgi:hypothetical protein